MQNKEYTIIVKNLPDNMDEGTLLSIFSQQAKIKSIRIMKDFKTKISRGFAYVNFFNENSMMNTFNNMRNFDLMGKKLEIILKNEIDTLERDLNILITNINLNDKDLVVNTLTKYGEIYSTKFEVDKENIKKLRCYVQYKTVQSAFNCYNNLENINGNKIITNFTSDNIVGIKINYIKSNFDIQKVLKEMLNNLKIKFNITKEKIFNNLFLTFNIFFNTHYDCIFIYYQAQLLNLKINNIINYEFIKVNKNKKMILKINNYDKIFNFIGLRSIIEKYGVVNILEEKEYSFNSIWRK